MSGVLFDSFPRSNPVFPRITVSGDIFYTQGHLHGIIEFFQPNPGQFNPGHDLRGIKKLTKIVSEALRLLLYSEKGDATSILTRWTNDGRAWPTPSQPGPQKNQPKNILIELFNGGSRQKVIRCPVEKRRGRGSQNRGKGFLV
jgi:hypothetical protein